MSNNSTIITNLYKCRTNVLNQLKHRGFDVSNYDEFSVNEIHMMYQKNQMDMLLSKENGETIYVKYHIHKKLDKNHMYTAVTELFDVEAVLDRDRDGLMIIVADEPNDTLVKEIQQVYRNEGVFVTVMNMKRLLFNILDHTLVPKHEVMTEIAQTAFLKKYNIQDKAGEVPLISRFDPVAMAIGLRPGQICEITRPSQTAIQAKYYRLCK